MASKVRQITIPVAFRTNTKALDTASGKFAMFGQAIAGIAVAAVASIGTIGIAATRLASNFEDSFAKIQGLVGVTKAELGALEEAAARLGPQFGKSATEAADALFFITSAGLRGDDAINVLEASLKGAAIGLGETKTIADLATSAVNAYGASNLDGAKAVDVLTEAVRLGKLEPAELAGAMGQVLPLASNLGVTFAEVGAAMAGMSKTGTDASTAATQLRQILSTIAKPTAEAEKTLAGMGMSAEMLRQQIRDEGLYDTLYDLTSAFDGNIEATSSVFGNVRALSGVLDLMGASAEDNRELFAQMTDEVGVLDEALEITADTASFKLARAMETARASMLPVGDMLLGIGASALDSLMPTIEMLGPLLNETFANLEGPLSELAGVLPSLLQALMPVLPLFGQIAAIFTDLVVALMPPLVALLDLLIPIFETLFATVGVFIADALVLLAPLITGVLEALLPLVESVLPIFTTLWEALAPIVLLFIETFTPILVALLPLLTLTLETLVIPALQMFAEVLSVLMPAAFQAFQNLGLIPNLEVMGSWAQGIEKFVHNVRVFVINAMNSLIEALETATNQAIAMLNKLIEAGKALPGAAGALFAGIRPISKVTFARIAMPAVSFGDYSNLDFGINTSTLAGIRAVSSGQGVPYRTNMGTIDTSSVSGIQQASGGRYFTIGAGEYFRPFAEGGLVTGPTLGLVGEAGPEAVIPLDKANLMGNTYNITVNAGMGTNGALLGEQIVSAIKKYERASGPVFASA